MNRSDWIGPLESFLPFGRINKNRYRLLQLLGFQCASKKDHVSLKHLQHLRPSIILFNSTKRSNGTERVNSTPNPSINVTISSLKTALSIRISIFTHGNS